MKCEVCGEEQPSIRVVAVSFPVTPRMDHWTNEKEFKVCENCVQHINFRRLKR